MSTNDSRCTRDLQKAGVPYPRTCQECGLGPCRRYPQFAKADPIPAPVPPAQPTDMAKMVEAAAAELVAFGQPTVDEAKAILLRHLQPLAEQRDEARAELGRVRETLHPKLRDAQLQLTAAQEELARERSQSRQFFAQMNRVNQWYNELIEVIYDGGCDGVNERPDPRTVVKNLRAMLASAEAALQSSAQKGAEDGKRLDWVFDKACVVFYPDGKHKHIIRDREAIDAARAKPEASP